LKKPTEIFSANLTPCNTKNMGKPKKKESKMKWTLNYDEKEQKDYLLGMRKRKDERRKKAKEEKKELVKEMQRNLRKEKLDFVKNRVKKVKHLLPANIQADEDDAEEDDAEKESTSSAAATSLKEHPTEEVVDYENHTVVVTDLSGSSSFANRPSYRDTAAVASDDDDEEEEDDEEEDEEDESAKNGKGYSVDGYKKKSMELYQKLQRIEGKHINKKQMFLQRKQKKKLLRKLKRKPKKGGGRN